MSLDTRLFSLALLPSNQPLRLPVSDYSTSRVMCDVPGTAVFCSKSTECLPGTASKFSLKPLVNIPVAPIITGIIIRFRFHIRCMSIQKLSYFSFFLASLSTAFLSAGTDCHIYWYTCYIFLFLIIIFYLVAATFYQ